MITTTRTLVVLLFLLVMPSAARPEVIIQAVGDIMLGGRWEKAVARDQYHYSFALMADELRQGDITLANLETPLTRRGRAFREKKFRFRADPSVAAALKEAGLTTVTLANNHSMDFGPIGLDDTLEALQQAGLDWIGAGANIVEARRMQLYTVDDMKVALLGYSFTLPQEFWAGKDSPGTAPLVEKSLKEEIADARKQADIVVVTVHWGEEGTTRLRPYQPRLARMMIDAGADAVIGHHPHVLQGIERYKRGIIFYSLGNFAFAHKSRIADRTLLVRLRFDGDKRSAELLPVNIRYREVGFQPTPLQGPKAEELMERLKKLPPGGLDIRREDERWLVDF